MLELRYSNCGVSAALDYGHPRLTDTLRPMINPFSPGDIMSIDDLTRTVIGCAFKVHNVLGAGFREKIYENALCIELQKIGVVAKQQDKLDVFYDGRVIGHCTPDLWIEGKLIIEIKGVQEIHKAHEVQLVHYLAATGVNDGLLINFGSSVQVKRKFRGYKPKSSKPITAIL